MPGEGAVVDGEGHLHGRGADLHEGQRLGKAFGADRVADGDVADAAHGDDVAGGRLGDGDAAEPVELVQAHGLGAHGGRVGVVVVADLDLLILAHDAALDAADGDAPDVFIIIYGADQHLEGGVAVHVRGGDVLEDGLEQGLEVGAR